MKNTEAEALKTMAAEQDLLLTIRPNGESDYAVSVGRHIYTADYCRAYRELMALKFQVCGV